MELDVLKEQLAHTEKEYETALAHLYRCDGAIQTLRHLIKELETPPVPDPE